MKNLPADWKQLFDSRIISRGKEYYSDGSVHNLKSTSKGYSAYVYGNDKYFVEIYGGENLLMSCSCPYADSGANCKHMAAVCFAVESGSDIKTVSKSDVFQLLDDTSENDVKEFMRRNVLTNPDSAEKFSLWMRESISKEEVKQYKNILAELLKNDICRYLDEYQYGYSLYEFFDELREFDDSKLEVMISRGFLSDAFEIIKFGMEILEKYNLNNDIEGGDVDSIVGDIFFRALDRILLTEKDKILESEIFTWLCGLAGNQRFSKSSLDMLMKFFKEKEYVEKKYLAVCDIVHGEEVYGAVLYKIRLMKELNFSNEDISEVVRDNWNERDVHNEFIQMSYNEGNLIVAAKLLEKSISAESDSSYVVMDRRRLRDLYFEMKDIEACRREARLICMDKGMEIDDFRMCRKLYPENWEEERENIIENAVSYRRNELLFEEKLYERLMVRLSGSSSVDEMNKYESVLGKLYPADVRSVYEKIVSEIVTEADNRGDYREIAELLSKIKSYEGGVEAVSRIVDGWRDLYRRRRAMWEEIRKMGIRFV